MKYIMCCTVNVNCYTSFFQASQCCCAPFPSTQASKNSTSHTRWQHHSVVNLTFDLVLRFTTSDPIITRNVAINVYCLIGPSGMNYIRFTFDAHIMHIIMDVRHLIDSFNPLVNHLETNKGKQSAPDIFLVTYSLGLTCSDGLLFSHCRVG